MDIPRRCRHQAAAQPVSRSYRPRSTGPEGPSRVLYICLRSHEGRLLGGTGVRGQGARARARARGKGKGQGQNGENREVNRSLLLRRLHQALVLLCTHAVLGKAHHSMQEEPMGRAFIWRTSCTRNRARRSRSPSSHRTAGTGCLPVSASVSPCCRGSLH